MFISASALNTLLVSWSERHLEIFYSLNEAVIQKLNGGVFDLDEEEFTYSMLICNPLPIEAIRSGYRFFTGKDMVKEPSQLIQLLLRTHKDVLQLEEATSHIQSFLVKCSNSSSVSERQHDIDAYNKSIPLTINRIVLQHIASSRDIMLPIFLQSVCSFQSLQHSEYQLKVKKLIKENVIRDIRRVNYPFLIKYGFLAHDMDSYDRDIEGLYREVIDLSHLVDLTFIFVTPYLSFIKSHGLNDIDWLFMYYIAFLIYPQDFCIQFIRSSLHVMFFDTSLERRLTFLIPEERRSIALPIIDIMRKNKRMHTSA